MTSTGPALQKPRPLSLSLGESGPGARATSPDRAWHARDDAGPCMRAHMVAGARAQGRDRAARARRASSRSLAADGGGRWEGPARREARGPAREPPGAGKTRLLLPLPLSPLPLALSALSFLSPRPLFTLSSASSSSPSAGLCGPCPRTPLSSASRTLLLHPRSPFLLGEDSWGAPSPLHPPLFSTRFLPGPPTAPSQCPSSRRRALPDLYASCTAALHSQAPLLTAPFLLSTRNPQQIHNCLFKNIAEPGSGMGWGKLEYPKNSTPSSGSPFPSDAY
ncbi:hypothetical protein LEMLEM_LOCUS19429 [Lemmus lemmus]